MHALLYSLSKKFIFIHVPKTAGTSVSLFLRPYSLPKRRTQWRRLLSKLPLPEAPEKAMLPVHATARKVRLKYGAQRFDEFYTFAFVRNPYDLFVSRYNYILTRSLHHNHQKYGDLGFADFARLELKKLRYGARDQVSLLDDGNGRLIVRHIYRFETLAEDMVKVCADLDIPMPDAIPQRNRVSRQHYSHFYDAESRAIVEQIFRRDLDMFGYRFETEPAGEQGAMASG